MMILRAFVTGGCLAAGVFSAVVGAPPSETWFSSCEGPIATCDRPRPSCVADAMRAAGVVRAESPVRLDDIRLRLPPVPERATPYFKADKSEPSHKLRPIPERRFQDARAVLMRWQAATKSRLPVTEADRLRLAHSRPDLSGLERGIAGELRGPIDAEALWERFDWSVVEEGDALLLAAVPKEKLDQLLCARFEVRLDRDWRVATLSFSGQDARDSRRIVFDAVEHTTAKITPASYEAESSEPARLRTAEIEDAAELTTPAVPRLVRETGELSLPIAPMDGFK